MVWLILLLVVSSLVELLSGRISRVNIQKVLAYLLIFIIAAASVAVLYLRPSLWGALIVYLSVFRVINLARLIDGRKQADYLRSSFLRTSLFLGGFLLIILTLTSLAGTLSLSFRGKWNLLIAVQLIVILVIALSFRRTLKKTTAQLPKEHIDSSKLPSLTVAIPARNETDDLDACLRSLITSDYPKLEILVLDDCSQEKRTPEIIRQFAHDGVRFLAGRTPNDNWTAKNYAYQQLAEEAEGKIILFCGVDTRFQPGTLRQMAELMITRKKTMVSFMPLNELPPDTFKRLLIQPVRYLWEMGLPRRSFNRPPVLSTCWLIERDTLSRSGQFKAVSRNIVPERYFARLAAENGDGYSFITSGDELGLDCNKSFNDQLETAARTRYPLIRQRPENVCYLSLIEAAVFIMPVGLFFYELASQNVFQSVVCLITVVLSGLILFEVTKLAYGRRLFVSAAIFPLVFAFDIATSVYSMFEYEFGQVMWKGRNVCLPVMRQAAKSQTPLNSAPQS